MRQGVRVKSRHSLFFSGCPGGFSVRFIFGSFGFILEKVVIFMPRVFLASVQDDRNPLVWVFETKVRSGLRVGKNSTMENYEDRN
jgi:hypothetical protein